MRLIIEPKILYNTIELILNMTSKATRITTTKPDSKKESNVPKGKEIVLYNIDEEKYETFIVPPGKQITFEYTLGTPFEYKINDDDKFSDYSDCIKLVDARGKEHDVITKHVVLSGDMCLPPVKQSCSYGYSGYSSYSKSRNNGGYSNSYSDPDDDDNNYDVSFMNCVHTNTGDDEDDGYEYGYGCGSDDE